MTTSLDTLLGEIGHERTLDEVARRADQALVSFQAGASQVTDWDAFRALLVRFLQHVERSCLRVEPTFDGRIDPDFDWGRCVQVLMAAFGREGEKAAFEMARTGNEGGLYRVLREMAHHVAGRLAQDEIAARVGAFWNGLSAEEQDAVCTAYLSRYGHLLPSEVTEGYAARIRARFPQVLI